MLILCSMLIYKCFRFLFLDKFIQRLYYYMLPEPITIVPPPRDKDSKKQGKEGNKTDDLFLYLQDELFRVSRSCMRQCEYFKNQCQPSQKIVFITEKLNRAMFEKVMKFLHGGPLTIPSIKQLSACLNILDFLHAPALVHLVEEQIEKNIQSYELFCLLEMAYNYGMQRVFDLCLCYLEFDQFEQIKYNKFDFLECGFKLFQIVLRRHHILKMKGQIEGLEIGDIEDVIKIYCQRKGFEEDIVSRLMQKYVVSLSKFEKVKTSLRLDKLAHKNILQSANIDTDFYENDGLQEGVEIEHSSIKKSRQLQRMHSAEVMKQQLLINQIIFNEKLALNEDGQSQAESIFQDSNNVLDSGSYAIKINNVQKDVLQDSVIIRKHDVAYRRNPEPLRQLEEQFKEKQADFAVNKMEDILNGYEQALNEHNEKYRSIRRNTTSLMVSNKYNGSQLLSKAKLLNSSNLNNQQLLFTLYEPRK